MKATLALLAVILLMTGCSDDPAKPANEADTLLLENAHFPCWSPDGATVICNRTVAGQEHTVWRISSTGTGSAALFQDTNCEYGPWSPKWLPDGRRIVYHRTRNEAKDSTYEFVIHDLDGGAAVVWPVPDFWHDAGFTLAADGTEVFYSTISQIMALDLGDGTTRLVGSGQSAALSPDGQSLVFCTEDMMYVTTLDGGGTVALEWGMDPDWTPDSQSIVFSGMGASGDIDLIIISRDGSTRSQLTDDPQLDLRPAVSPLGDKIVYVKTPDNDTGPFNLRCLDLDPD